MLNAKNFYRGDYVIDGAERWRTNAELLMYLASANLRISDVAASRPLVAQAALFPHLGVVRVSGPRTTVTWARDAGSLDRVIILVVRSGEVQVRTEGPVLRRDPGVIVLLPSESSAEISLMAAENELFYISAPASLLDEMNASAWAMSPSRLLPPVDEGVLVPPMMYLIALSRASVKPGAEVTPLQHSATEVVKSILRVVLDDVAAPRSLFDRAIEIILAEYSNPQLSVARTAHRLGASVRTLQMAFSEEAATCQSVLRDVRVRAARRLRQCNSGMSNVAIARAVGFGSESALYRALRVVTEDHADPGFMQRAA
ncbi:helix-turn-helix domain-containing protein [Microbacterium sp. A204]|uniref:helix-turn-helix domain-containing protein n=1 Tax=Microbacterium sp. A204 TaxID=3457321 RepID=UPI003FD53BFD